jgi:hypothetical protein
MDCQRRRNLDRIRQKETLITGCAYENSQWRSSVRGFGFDNGVIGDGGESGTSEYGHASL